MIPLKAGTHTSMIIEDKLRRSVMLLAPYEVRGKIKNDTRFGAIFDGEAENHDKT